MISDGKRIKLDFWYVFALLVVTFVVYANTFNCSWTYDDFPVIVNNPDVKSLKGFLSDSYKGRPLRELSFLVDHFFFDDRPSGYHIQQNLFHFLNGSLLFLIFSRLKISKLVSFFSALIFIVHPIQVEAVANISNRKELLALFFGLTSIYCYIRHFDAERKWKLIFLILSVFSYFLAVLAKQTIFPVILLIVGHYIFHARSSYRIKVASFAGVFASLVVITKFYFTGDGFFAKAKDHMADLLVKNNYFEDPEFTILVKIVGKAIYKYVVNIAYPFRLAPEYVISVEKTSISIETIFGYFVLFVTVALIFFLRNRHPVVSLGLLWWILFYIPVSNIIPLGTYSVSDRYVYIMFPGLLLAISALIEGHINSYTICIPVLIVITLSAFTIKQNRVWMDTYSLWRHAAAINGDSAISNYQAGIETKKIGSLVEARSYLVKSLSIHPYYLKSYIALGEIEQQTGNYAKAINYFETFLKFAGNNYPGESLIVRGNLSMLKYMISQKTQGASK